VERILELWTEKAYRLETLFLAINIFDRILSIDLKFVHKSELILYAVTSLIIAAKQEQPLSPSISRMVRLLTPNEQSIASKQAIIALEEKILSALDFDFNMVSPL
jgi:hypothetical protein